MIICRHCGFKSPEGMSDIVALYYHDCINPDCPLLKEKVKEK